MSKVYCKDCKHLKGVYTWHTGPELATKYRCGWECALTFTVDEPLGPETRHWQINVKNESNDCADFQLAEPPPPKKSLWDKLFKRKRM